MSGKLLRAVPTLRVEDAMRSVAFYGEQLGFKEDWRHQHAPALPWFVSLSRDGLSVFLTEHPECAAGALVYFYVADVDDLFRAFGARGAVTEQAPVDRPWGMREMQIRDPDGNRLRFGQHVEGVTG